MLIRFPIVGDFNFCNGGRRRAGGRSGGGGGGGCGAPRIAQPPHWRPHNGPSKEPPSCPVSSFQPGDNLPSTQPRFRSTHLA